MRTLLLFTSLLASALLTGSCNRDDEDTIIVANDTTYSFRVDGLRDMRISAGSGLNLTLPVVHESGTQQTVRLSITGVPNNVGAIIEPATGVPNFSSSLQLRSNIGATRGTYPLQLTATPESGPARTYRFNLVVADNAVSCDSLVGLGQYNAYDDCTPGANYTVSVTKDPAGAARYVINNFRVPGGPTTALQLTADCQSGTLTIPTQTITGGGTIYGNGTIISGVIGLRITFRLGSAGSYTTCNALLNR
jgi:hypothetical protein